MKISGEDKRRLAYLLDNEGVTVSTWMGITFSHSIDRERISATRQGRKFYTVSVDGKIQFFSKKTEVKNYLIGIVKTRRRFDDLPEKLRQELLSLAENQPDMYDAAGGRGPRQLSALTQEKQ